MSESAFADDELVPVTGAYDPATAEPDVTHYTLAAEALHRICLWVFIGEDGKVRKAQDSKCRMLAVASVVNPTAFQPQSFRAAAKANGFTCAILSLRIQEFCKAFGMHMPDMRGMDSGCHKAKRLKAYGKV